MQYRIYKEEDFLKSKWTGGTTVQLGIFPEHAKYTERNFVWRLSSATCELEETTFSKLPDYDRVLMVLAGSVVLAHQDVRVAKLGPLEQDRFDGAYVTKSFGKITDYNLMVSKGNEGFLDVISLTSESERLEEETCPGFSRKTTALYCKEGYATVTLGGKTEMLTQGQQLIADFEGTEKEEISLMGEGTLIRAQIFYDYCQEEMEATVIPAEKASFDDFKACVYLANIQFRGAKYIFKNLKKQWFDEELTRAINKLERLYIPFFITILGACAVALLGQDVLTTGALVGAVLAWVLIDIFLISPLLYFAVVPKPTRKHIKNIDALTPYEQALYEKQKGSNERLERLLKKYDKAGKIVYDEDGNAKEK